MSENKTPLEHQVAGHAGTMTTDESGIFLIKTTSQREIDFYNVLAPQLSPKFVGNWTPRFYGTLSLQGQPKPGASPSKLNAANLTQLAVKEGQSAVVLENLTSYFKSPCVIDFKLGKQLWDEAASPEKREKMTQDAAGTTIQSKGLRLTGCKIYNAQTGNYDVTPKQYGKDIKDNQLTEALMKCFPNHLPQDKLKAILQVVLTFFEAYIQDVQHIEWRLRGSSVLIIYEGDLASLDKALEQPYLHDNCSPVEEEDDSDEEENSTDEQESDAKTYFPAVLLKAVDFAHAWDYEGQGADTGYNEGLANLMHLIKARLDQLSV